MEEGKRPARRECCSGAVIILTATGRGQTTVDEGGKENKTNIPNIPAMIVGEQLEI